MFEKKYELVLIILILSTSGVFNLMQSKTKLAPKNSTIRTDKCEAQSLAISNDLKPFIINLKIVKVANYEKDIKSLIVTRPDKLNWTQELQIHSTEPFEGSAELIYGSKDINSDGYNDLFFTTSYGIANYYKDYWLYDSLKQEFVYIGNFPSLKLENNNLLSSYERDGAVAYIRKKYKFINDKLTVIEIEEQTGTDDVGIFRYKLSRLVNNKMKVIKDKKIKVPKPE